MLFPLLEIIKSKKLLLCLYVYVSDRMFIWGVQDKADFRHGEKNRNGFMAERELGWIGTYFIQYSTLFCLRIYTLKLLDIIL